MKKLVVISSLGALFASLLIGACSSTETATKDTTRSAMESVPSPTWKCSDSSYDGVQYMTCAGGTTCAGRHAKPNEYCDDAVLFFCENGEARKIVCSDGCIGHPDGTNDECR